MPPRPLQISPLSNQRSLTIKQLLIASPLPSPALPSILPRHGKKPPRINSRRLLRISLWFTFIVLLFRCYEVFQDTSPVKPHGSNRGNLKHSAIVTDATPPPFAAPFAFTNRRGQRKWTMSVPSKLKTSEYGKLCADVDHVAAQTALSNQQQHLPRSQRDLYERDPNYVDITDATLEGHLPSTSDRLADQNSNLPVCDKSLTFVLDGSNAALGSQMLQLWLAYGLARREGRALFIDDQDFSYGNITTYFPRPAATPSCRAPSPKHIIPCPRQAKHLTVSTTNLDYVFGQPFREHFDRKDIYDMIREGYEALWGGILANIDDEVYAQQRVHNLTRDAKENGQHLVGLHVRRGGHHALEISYRQSYIPLSRFISVASSISTSAPSTSQPIERHNSQPSQIKLIAASDDSSLYTSPDFFAANITRAQDRISLGWQGGFYDGIFHSLGGVDLSPEARRHHYAFQSPAAAQPSKAQSQSPSRPNQQSQSQSNLRQQNYPSDKTNFNPIEDATDPRDTQQMREYIARSYLLDLAILSRASERVICVASSSGCRILGIMMGWDRVTGVGGKNKGGMKGWVNVDYGVKEVDWSGLY